MIDYGCRRKRWLPKQMAERGGFGLSNRMVLGVYRYNPKYVVLDVCYKNRYGKYVPTGIEGLSVVPGSAKELVKAETASSDRQLLLLTSQQDLLMHSPANYRLITSFCIQFAGLSFSEANRARASRDGPASREQPASSVCAGRQAGKTVQAEAHVVLTLLLLLLVHTYVLTVKPNNVYF